MKHLVTIRAHRKKAKPEVVAALMVEAESAEKALTRIRVLSSFLQPELNTTYVFVCGNERAAITAVSIS